MYFLREGRTTSSNYWLTKALQAAVSKVFDMISLYQ